MKEKTNLTWTLFTITLLYMAAFVLSFVGILLGLLGVFYMLLGRFSSLYLYYDEITYLLMVVSLVFSLGSISWIDRHYSKW